MPSKKYLYSSECIDIPIYRAYRLSIGLASYIHTYSHIVNLNIFICGCTWKSCRVFFIRYKLNKNKSNYNHTLYNNSNCRQSIKPLRQVADTRVCVCCAACWCLMASQYAQNLNKWNSQLYATCVAVYWWLTFVTFINVLSFNFLYILRVILVSNIFAVWLRRYLCKFDLFALTLVVLFKNPRGWWWWESWRVAAFWRKYDTITTCTDYLQMLWKIVQQ